YLPADHIAAINNSLPDEYLGQKTQLDRAPVVSYCGSWLPRKGTHLLRSDIPRLLEEFPACTLRLIGVGSHFQIADHFPSSLRSRVEVTPFVHSRTDLRALYQSLAILVVPSVYESFGLVTAEAMSCGAAVVAARTGFAAGLKDREEALLLNQPQPGD